MMVPMNSAKGPAMELYLGAALKRVSGAAHSIGRVPSWSFGVVGTQKSFAKNPIIGNPWLNELGLHVGRVQLAAALAHRRRSRLAPALSPEDRTAFDRDGFIVKRNFLPPDVFEAMRGELFGQDFAAREMRQGRAVQRMIPLSSAVLGGLPATRQLVEHRDLRALTAYAASRRGEPIHYLQTVIAEADGPDDPQTVLHSDTFHATAKGWYFFHDVGEEDGPFCYVPGSHRLTDRRLAWERQQSLSASRDTNSHHADGSFRATPDDLAAMGDGAPVPVAVPANTLVVADTFGFHARARSLRPTTRVTLYTYTRRNPFLPWTGLDPASLPGLRGRALPLYLGMQDLQERFLGRRGPWRKVAPVRIDAPATL